MKREPKIELGIEGETLVLKSQTEPRYTLEGLIAEGGVEKRISKEDRGWLNLSREGREL